MQIKTTEGEKDVASVGLAGTALGLAIPGTVALLNQMGGCGNGGILGNLFGGGGCNNGANGAAVSHDTRVIGALESKIAKLESERYTDAVGLELYKQTVLENKNQTEKTNSNFKELYSFIVALDKQIAVDKVKSDCQYECLSGRVSVLEGLTKTIIPQESICPPVMPRYNSWTAPTASTPSA
jgi:hypothetical protein